uniref:Uncharacterized protein n=1 Tax=Myoviridae sp. ctlRg1 TaxID=2826692 RepID=A0A8S5M6F8_9CAUD|nr:MAG TPA: hypothetical protein [Myoviridae sp. ctlRg1]
MYGKLSFIRLRGQKLTPKSLKINHLSVNDTLFVNVYD